MWGSVAVRQWQPLQQRRRRRLLRASAAAMPGGSGGAGGGGAQAVGAVALGGALLGLAAYGIAQLDERKRQNAPDVHMSPVTIAADDAASGRAGGASGRLLVLWDMCVAPSRCTAPLPTSDCVAVLPAPPYADTHARPATTR